MNEAAFRDVERSSGGRLEASSERDFGLGLGQNQWRDKIEVRLDNRQVFFLFFGSALCACMLFVLGVIVGKRLESRGRAAIPEVQDPLAVLDRMNGGAAAPGSAPAGAKAEPSLTFPKALISPAARPHAAPAAASRPLASAAPTVSATAAKSPAVPAAAAKAPAVPTAAAKAPAVPAAAGKTPAVPAAAAKAPVGPKMAPPVAPRPTPAPTPSKVTVSNGRLASTVASKPSLPAAAAVAVAPALPAAAPTPPASGKGKYSLVLSSFPERAEAEALAKRFAAQGAYVAVAESPGKATVYRVRVGNYASTQEAAAAKTAFEKQTNTIAYVAGR